jgi:tetratricopeptide (TPR) repeat protein
MHLPPVEPEVPPADLRADMDRGGVRLTPPREETTQNAIAIVHHVTARIRNAENLMARGACFAARAELLQALKAIAQSLDERDGTRRHGDALAFALRAFQEAGDLTSRGAGLASPVNLDLTIRGHRTPVLWNENVNRLTPVAAQQRYMAYAQEQLVEACRGEMAAAEALYVLARINTVLEHEKPESSLLCLPQAMVMFRAALEIDPRHGRAANELGVLLAGCGRYAEARDALLHSVTVSPTPESWHNLSVVHVRLGNAELAQRAQQESMAAAPPRGTRTDNAMQSVKWVDPETFRAQQAAPTATQTRR